LVTAGSGATLPLIRVLADGFAEESPDLPVWVAESIGTGGAVRALADGAIDLGLASRPIDREEISEFVVARATLEVGVHPGVPDIEISWAFLLDAARGQQVVWADGSPVVFVHREAGDSGVRAVEAVSPELGEAIATGQALALVIAYTDADATHFLATVPGAIGIYDPVAARLLGERVRTMRVSDAPGWARSLSVFWHANEEPHEFISYLRGPVARALIARLGYERP
jgi:phosphate transport system substrate-binding protein